MPPPETATTARAWCAGLRAAVEAIDGFDGTARRTFTRGGIAFQNAAGGASGALVGAWLIAIGTGLPDRDEAVDAAAVALALDQALATLQGLGQAQPGDKTMVDTLAPFCAALNEAAAQRTGASLTPGRRRSQRRRPGCSRRSTWSAAAAAPRAWASARGASRMPARRRSTTSCTRSAPGSRSSDIQENRLELVSPSSCRRSTSFMAPYVHAMDDIGTR